MKSTAVVLLICGVLLAAGGCAKQTGEAQKIGVVDVGRVFQESSAGKQGMAYLQSINEDFRKEFEKMQQGTDEQAADAQKMQQSIAEFQAKIGQEQERIVTLLNEEFRMLLESFRQENNFTVLLSQETVLSATDGVNVTDRIIQEFDKLKIDLAPKVAPPAVQEQQTPAPGEQNATQ
jgi:outer membrane protein